MKRTGRCSSTATMRTSTQRLGIEHPHVVGVPLLGIGATHQEHHILLGQIARKLEGPRTRAHIVRLDKRRLPTPDHWYPHHAAHAEPSAPLSHRPAHPHLSRPPPRRTSIRQPPNTPTVCSSRDVRSPVDAGGSGPRPTEHVWPMASLSPAAPKNAASTQVCTRKPLGPRCWLQPAPSRQIGRSAEETVHLQCSARGGSVPVRPGCRRRGQFPVRARGVD